METIRPSEELEALCTCDILGPLEHSPLHGEASLHALSQNLTGIDVTEFLRAAFRISVPHFYSKEDIE